LRADGRIRYGRLISAETEQNIWAELRARRA
jgi:hypothetical protein